MFGLKKYNLWFSILSKDAKYSSDEPAFIDVKEFDWVKNTESMTNSIREELLEYLKKSNLPSYFNTKMSEDVKKWKTVSLKWWTLEFYRNQQHFPITTKFINSIPHLVSASFNLLEPHSRILPHCGDTNGIYRCHLGLIIPGELPDCGFRVENEKKPWKEGEWLIFIDAKEHEAWNSTDKDRLILVIDIIRPAYFSKKNSICSIVLTGLFLQRRAEKYHFLYKLKDCGLIRKTWVGILTPFCYVSIKIRNVLSSLKIVS